MSARHLILLLSVILSQKAIAQTEVSLKFGFPKTQGMWFITKAYDDKFDFQFEMRRYKSEHAGYSLSFDTWYAETADPGLLIGPENHLYLSGGLFYKIPILPWLNMINQMGTGPCLQVADSLDKTLLSWSWLASPKISALVRFERFALELPYFQYDIPLFVFRNRDDRTNSADFESGQFLKGGVGVSFFF